MPVVPPAASTVTPGRRTPFDEKIRRLGGGQPREATLARLGEYQEVFAYRRTDAIVTRVGRGPVAWTKLPKPLTTGHLARHLLGDALPGLGPVWYGARDCSTTRWSCLDIDADRMPESLVAEEYDLARADEDGRRLLLDRARRRAPPRPPFADRLAGAERALRRLGVRPDDPRQVLSLETPSGGTSTSSSTPPTTPRWSTPAWPRPACITSPARSRSSQRSTGPSASPSATSRAGPAIRMPGPVPRPDLVRRPDPWNRVRFGEESMPAADDIAEFGREG